MSTISKQIVTLASITLALLAASTAQADEHVFRNTLRSSAFIVNLSERGSGSGVLVDRDRGHLLTNYHVVGDAEEVAVFFPHFEDQRLIAERRFYAKRAGAMSVAGRVIGRDPSRDLALVELDHIPEGVEPITLAPRGPQPGQRVHSIGNPGASDALWVYTAGRVRAVYHREMAFPDGMILNANIVETSSPINAGDSGGPVVNDDGQLVALIQSHGANDISVCIDVTELQGFLEGGAKSKGDPRVGHALDKQGLKYKVDQDGDYRLTFRMEDGREHVVFVMSQTKELGSLELRHIWSPICSVDESFSLDQASLLLQVAGQCKLGSCEFVGGEDRRIAIFCAKLPAHLDGPALEVAVRSVVDSAYRIREVCRRSSDKSDGQAPAAVRTDRIDKSSRTMYSMEFPGVDEARVTVVGDGDTDLDLFVLEVTAENGELEFKEVGRDEREGDRCELAFQPRADVDYLVVVINYGDVYNEYTLRADGAITAVEANKPLQNASSE